MVRKISAFALVFILAFSFIAMAAPQFDDVTNASHPWAVEAISDMADKKIINGYGDGTFLPNRSVTKMESLLLISRVLGYSFSTAIIDNSDNIFKAYEDQLSGITQYKQELAFLIWNGIFTADELKAISFNDPLTREETAYYITKAIKGVDEAKLTNVVINPYADDDKISEQYRNYVYFVRDKEYMTGSGENGFTPKDNITRAQIAVLLYRVMPRIDTTFTKGTIESVNTSNNTAKIFVVTQTYNIESDMIIRNKGISIPVSALYQNLNAIVTMVNGRVIAIDSFFDLPTVNNTVDGDIRALTSSPQTTVQIRDPDTLLPESYVLSDNCRIIINGSDSEFNKLRTGDYAVLSLNEYGRAVKIEILPPTKDFSDLIIDDIVVTETSVSLKVSSKSGEESTFTVNPIAVSVKKNGTKAELSTLNPGDKITRLSLKFNRVDVIEVTSEIKSSSGIITQIVVSSNPVITVTSGSVSTDYNITKDTKIYIHSELKTIYDLKLANSVNLTVEGSTVTRIDVSAQSATTDTKGIVEAVNSSYGFITVKTADGNLMQIFVNATKTQIVDNNSKGQQKTIRDIKVGQNVTVIGAMVNGAFEAQTIVIT